MLSSIDDPATKKLLDKEIEHMSGKPPVDNTLIPKPSSAKKVVLGKKKKKMKKKKKSVTTSEKIEESAIELTSSPEPSDLPVSKLK